MINIHLKNISIIILINFTGNTKIVLSSIGRDVNFMETQNLVYFKKM